MLVNILPFLIIIVRIINMIYQFAVNFKIFLMILTQQYEELYTYSTFQIYVRIVVICSVIDLIISVILNCVQIATIYTAIFFGIIFIILKQKN